MLIEHKLLFCATEIDSDEKKLDDIRKYFASGIDVKYLVNLAGREGLCGFLYKALKKADVLKRIEGPEKDILQAGYYSTKLRNQNLLIQVKDVLCVLNREKIPAVLLQGISLLYRTYADKGLRAVSDVDLWVLPSFFSKIPSLMIAGNFEKDPDYPHTFKRGTLLLDFHTKVMAIKSERVMDQWQQKHQSEIFKSAENVDVDGQIGLILNPNDQFLQLGIQAIRKNLKRLIWLVDIKNLVSNWEIADWKKLDHRVREFELQKIQAYILFTLDKVFGFRPPSDYHRGRQNNELSILERKILQRRINGHQIPSWARIILISGVLKLKPRIRFIFQAIIQKLGSILPKTT